MSTLSKTLNKDTMIVGIDIKPEELSGINEIRWNNRGEIRLILRSYIDNMLQHLENVSTHPGHHRGRIDAFIFYWEQTYPIAGSDGADFWD